MRSGSSIPGKSTVCSGKIGIDSRRRRSSRFFSKSALQVAVPQHDGIVGFEGAREALGDEYRAMPPAGASDRDRDGGALVEDEARQPALQEALDVLDEESR